MMNEQMVFMYFFRNQSWKIFFSLFLSLFLLFFFRLLLCYWACHPSSSLEIFYTYLATSFVLSYFFLHSCSKSLNAGVFNLFLFFEDVLFVCFSRSSYCAANSVFSFVQLFVKQITCQNGYVALRSNLAH